MNESSNIPEGLCQCGCGGKTSLAIQTETRSGSIKGKPKRFLKFHAVRVRIRPTLSERFWEKVDILGKDDCWNWTACKNSDGYGEIRMYPSKDKAHRIAYKLTHGEIIDGMEVCHKCDNPSCCNPKHLFLGTHRDNILDMYAKGRRVKKVNSDIG